MRCAAILALVLAPASHAQFGVQWVTFAEEPGLLSVPDPISGLDIEVDFAWGDLDQDGWTDLVVVRKEPFSALGKRTNLLLRNEYGVLTDRTASFATASDVPGDQGFATPTADRDVTLSDVDLDGWLDVITAVDVSPADSKAVGHPRVYRNLGSAGAWLGLEYQEARIPQLLVHGSGLPVNPLFLSVSAGDVTADGAPDLYFTDKESDPLYSPPAGTDLDDRLLVNDGHGWFADESLQRMTPTMLDSEFGAHARIADVNLDGVADVVKNTTLNHPLEISVLYNDPSNAGQFHIFDPFYEGGEPYHFDLGDLNNDGRLDVVIADDLQDRYMYNTGTDLLGRVVWGPKRTFEFLTGGDDGFGSNPLVVDLDEDGWNDVVMCDISDGTPTGYVRRIHIYHNPGGAVGEEILLREEREHGGSSSWLGAVGLYEDDLGAGHDVAAFDVDGDGDKDLILGRKDGTFAWANQLDPGICQPTSHADQPGTLSLALCGEPLFSGSGGELQVTGAAPGATVFLGYGFSSHPTAFAGGTLVPLPPVGVLPVTADALGAWSIPVAGGGGPWTVYLQAVAADAASPGGWALSNAVAAEVLP